MALLNRFFKCPSCNDSVKFMKIEYTVFLENKEDPMIPGPIYETKDAYKCLKCGYVVCHQEE